MLTTLLALIWFCLEAFLGITVVCSAEALPFAVFWQAGLDSVMLCLADRLSCMCSGSAAAVTLAVVVAATGWAVISAPDLLDWLFCLAGLLGWPVLAVLSSLPAVGLLCLAGPAICSLPGLAAVSALALAREEGLGGRLLCLADLLSWRVSGSAVAAVALRLAAAAGAVAWAAGSGALGQTADLARMLLCLADRLS